MSSPAPELPLDAEQRAELVAMASSSSSTRRHTQRANIILLAATGMSNSAIAEKTGARRSTVLLWRSRYAADGVAGLLKEKPHTGRKPTITSAVKEAIINDMLYTNPVHEISWCAGEMAWRHKVSESTVQQLWASKGLGDLRSRQTAIIKARTDYLHQK